MFEDYIRSLLVKYVSNILDEVDEQQIELGISNGSLKLNDVKMKPSFLDDIARPFPFPIKFHAATVRELHIAVNSHTWAALTSHPLHVHIEGVRIWAEADAYDELIGVDSAYVQKRLQKAVQDKLAKLQSEEDAATADKSDESSGGPSVILARIISAALASLQFELHDVHICLSVPGVGLHPGATFGIALEMLDLVTTDEEFRINVNQSILSKLWPNTYKRLAISKLSVYFNPDARAPELSEEHTDADAVKMHPPPPRSREAARGEALPSKPLISAAEVHSSDNHFILYPSSILLTLKYNKNVVPTVTGDIVVKAESLPLRITRPQYVTLMHLMDVVDTRSTQVDDFIDQMPEKEMTPHQRKRYIFLYKRTLNALWLPALSDYERKEMEALETEMPLSQLSLLRRAARHELKRELAGREDVQERGKALDSRVHWWDKLFVGADQTKKNIEAKAAPEQPLTEGQRAAILEHETQRSDRVKEEETNTLFSADDLLKKLVLDFTVKLAVDQVSLELWDEKDKDEPSKAKMDSMSEDEARLDVNKRADAAVDKEQRMIKSQPNADRSVAHSMHNVKPLARVNINFLQVNAIIMPDNEIKLEAGLHSLSALDLTALSSAEKAAREFIYIGGLDDADMGVKIATDDGPSIAAPFSSHLTGAPTAESVIHRSGQSSLNAPGRTAQPPTSPLQSPQLQHDEHAEAQEEHRKVVASAKHELQDDHLHPIEHKEQVREKVLDDQFSVLKSPNIHAASARDLREKKDTDLSKTIAPEVRGLWISLHRAPESNADKTSTAKKVEAVLFGEGDKDQSTTQPTNLSKSRSDEHEPKPVPEVSKSGHRNTAGVQLGAAKKFSGSQIRTTMNIDLTHLHIAFTRVLTELPDFLAGPPNAYSDKEKKGSNLPLVTDPYAKSTDGNDASQFDLTRATKDIGGSERDYQHLKPDAEKSSGINRDMKQKIGTVAPANKAVEHILDDGANKSTTKSTTLTTSSTQLSTQAGGGGGGGFETVVRPSSTQSSSLSAPPHEEMPPTQTVSSSSSGSSLKGTSEANVTVQGEDDTVDLDALIASLPASEAIEAKMNTDSTLSLVSFFSPLAVDLNITDPIIQFTPELADRSVGLHVTLNLGAQGFVDTARNKIQAEAALTGLKILAGESTSTDARYIQMPTAAWKLAADDLTVTIDQPLLNILTFINGPALTWGQKLKFIHDHLQMIVKQNVFSINIKP